MTVFTKIFYASLKTVIDRKGTVKLDILLDIGYNPVTMITTTNGFISVGQAVKKLEMNYKKICRWADSGLIPCIRTAGGHRRVDISSLITDKTEERISKLTSFGAVLRKFRLDRGLTLTKLATDIGISTTFLSNIENGTKKVPWNFLGRICKAYNLRKNVLADFQEAMKITLEKEQKAIHISLAGADDLARKMAFRLAERLLSLTEAEIKGILEILDEKTKESTKNLPVNDLPVVVVGYCIQLGKKYRGCVDKQEQLILDSYPSAEIIIENEEVATGIADKEKLWAILDLIVQGNPIHFVVCRTAIMDVEEWAVVKQIIERWGSDSSFEILLG